MSGRLEISSILPRSRLARAMGREEKASKFCVMREKRDLKARWQSLLPVAAMGGRCTPNSAPFG